MKKKKKKTYHFSVDQCGKAALQDLCQPPENAANLSSRAETVKTVRVTSSA